MAATALAACLVGSLAGAQTVGTVSGPTTSRVTSLEIVSRRSAFGGRAFGNVGPYELLTGRARALIDPRAAINGAIVDLDKAPRNAAGLVEYTFDVLILKPVDIRKGSGTLFYEFN